MLALRNTTGFPAALVPWLDSEGRDSAIVVMKATFQVDPAKGVVAGQGQVPLLFADEFYREAATSSVKYATEACPPKVGTDVILRGHAWAPKGGATSVDVSLRVAKLAKTIRVVGERRYFRSVGAWQVSSPVKFERMPLVWERAFGGADPSSGSPAEHAVHPQNPVGTGYAPSRSAKRLEGLALPNLEDPRAPITTPDAPGRSVGFGFVASHWLPRRSYAGTYDERWKQEQAPYLPVDFDDRFFSAAPEGLIAEPHLKGGEELEVLGATLGGRFAIRLPAIRWSVSSSLAGRRSEHVPVLDTVVVEPDERRVLLTWKVAIPCARRFLQLDKVTVSAVGFS